MARPKKEKPVEGVNVILAERDAEYAAKEKLLHATMTDEQIEEAIEKFGKIYSQRKAEQLFTKDWISPEQFLNSKGIDPAIKSSPIQNITFIQLCELLNEYKNA